MIERRDRSRRPDRYDLWVEHDGHERREVVAAVAALLGLDPRRAGKLVDQRCPILRQARHGEVCYLRARFSDLGLRVRVEPELAGLQGPASASSIGRDNPADIPAFEVWVGMAVAGAVVGGVVSFVASMIWISLGLAQNVALAMTFTLLVIPLLASSGLGMLFGWKFSRPRLSTRVLVTLVALIAVILGVEIEGSRAIEDCFEGRRSSDLTGPLLALGLVAICVGVAAPLSAGIVARGQVPRSRRGEK
jgi:hypothetical protein